MSTSLDHVRADASPYPVERLEGLKTGLVLFAAAFQGRNDAVHFERAGLRTMCVDVDAPRLEAMRELYPDDWRFVHGDAWEIAAKLRAHGRRFDAVSVDTFSGAAMRRALDDLELWTSVATKLVTVTLTWAAPFEAPPGWGTWSLFPRNGRGVFWLVLEPEK